MNAHRQYSIVQHIPQLMFNNYLYTLCVLWNKVLEVFKDTYFFLCSENDINSKTVWKQSHIQKTEAITV